MDQHPPVYINLEERADGIVANLHRKLVNGGRRGVIDDADDILSPSQDDDDDDDHYINTNKKKDDTTSMLYSQLRRYYNDGNFIEIMFLLPQISQLNIVPPIFHLIIGCTMVHFGRLSSAFREIGVAICLAPNEADKKEFIKVLAFTYADLNDKDSAMGCLGEILDISRASILGTKQFDEMKFEIIQLEKELLLKLEQAKSIKQPVKGKNKSFDDQVMDLIALHKVFPKDSFTGKCQIIIGKINQAEKLLQTWDKERKPLVNKQNPLKLLVEAILVLGPSIAYYGMLKLEPILNQYFDFVQIQANANKPHKTRTVSAFFLGGLTPLSSSAPTTPNADGEIAAKPNASSLNNGTVFTFQLIKIIRGFIAMLRHEYKEAHELFLEAEDANFEYNNHVLILKYICQSNEPHQHRKELELLAHKISKLPFVSTFKFHTLAKIYQKLYILEQASLSRHRRRGILKTTLDPKYDQSLLKFYTSAAAYARDDDLYVTLYYDNILNFLLDLNKDFSVEAKEDIVHFSALVFFYQVRNYFCLKSDYNYVYIPGLVCDWQEIKTNTKLKLRIKQFLEADNGDSVIASTTTTGVATAAASAAKLHEAATNKKSTKLFDMIGYWEKEYIKFKGTVPDAIKQYLRKK